MPSVSVVPSTASEMESLANANGHETESLNASAADRSFDSILSSPRKLQSPRSSTSGSPTFSERLKSATRLIPGRARLVRSTGDKDSNDSMQEGEETSKAVRQPSDFRTLFREHFILLEYKAVYRNPQGGVYVVPSLKSLQVWHGIIFLRAGPYREGIFRFFIFLQDDFPDSRPLIKFTSSVFHPQVNQNGVFNLDPAFPNWQRGKNSIWQILKYMKNCFYSADTYGGVNKEAVNAVHNSMEEFKEKARSCALESQRIFDEETESSVEDGNILKVKKMTDTEFQEAKKLMMQGELPRHSPPRSHTTY